MLRTIINALSTATRAFFGNAKTAAIFVALYAAFVCAVYLFFTTPEARLWQVALTIVLVLASASLFFALQTLAVRYTHPDHQLKELLAETGREFWKLLVISLPVLLVTWLVIWGLTTLETSLTTGIREAASAASTDAAYRAGEERIKTIALVMTVLSALILYFITPLCAIHLWIATLRSGFKQTLKGSVGILLRAFAPGAVLTYLLGSVAFAVLPYFILTTRTPIKSPWLDLTVLGLRIALALLAVLVGWVITVGALGLLAPPPPATVKAPETPPLNAQAASL